MVSPLFGWSAGDVVRSIQIITKLCKAFREEGGAASHFAETVAFLDAFLRVLNAIKDFSNSQSDTKYGAEINAQISLIDGPYTKFEAYLLKFKPSPGAESSSTSIRKASKKTQWAMHELSEVSGKASQFKKAVKDPLLYIGPLLALQSL